MVEVPEAPDQYAVDIANVVGVPDHPTFALVNMRSPELPADVLAVLRRLAYAPEGTAATHIPGFLARAIGAKVLEYAPEVAEPGAKLAKEADFLAFARSVMPDRHPDEVLKRARPTWDALGRAADTIEGARGWLTLLPVLRKQPVDLSLGGNDYSHQQVRRIAAMPLRFVLPHDHEATGARELSVDPNHETPIW